MQLLKEAQQKFGVENTCTVKGNVYVSIKKKKHLIKYPEALQSVLPIIGIIRGICQK